MQSPKDAPEWDAPAAPGESPPTPNGSGPRAAPVADPAPPAAAPPAPPAPPAARPADPPAPPAARPANPPAPAEPVVPVDATLPAAQWPSAPPVPPRVRRIKYGEGLTGELEQLQMQAGRHPGDRYVRRVRPPRSRFRRLGPGHLEALRGTLEPVSPAGRLFAHLKHVVIGSPLSTAAAIHERLTKVKALAVLSSDALSSVTYATEAILATLLLAGTGAFEFNIPIAIAIAALIVVVVFSYRQTIYAYPKGGGSYIVSKDNLGTLPGLVAGGSLLTGYTLTVAVSIAAGVANLISLAATLRLGDLSGHRVEVALVAVLLLVLLNLRGIRESGTIFSAPTYIFLALMFTMLGLGLYQYFVGGNLGTVQDVPDVVPAGLPSGAVASAGFFLLLRAFAAGCAALTGIEAISDGVPAFKPPESRNAATTLVTLGALLGMMFLGISFLADQVHVQISHTETVVSQLGRTIFGSGPVYTVFLVFTALLLVLAANTAFADFPRLSFFLARDRFLPHQFAFRGDRLAFSFGIITLGVLAGLLIILFGGSTEGLLPLYAIGVFTSFTLSQSGMVMRWWRRRPKGWRLSLTFNALGALTTLGVTLILAVTRFAEGAWLVMIVVPLIVLMFLRIHHHYEDVSDMLSLADTDPAVGRAAAAGAILPGHPMLNLPYAGDGEDGDEEPMWQRLEHLVVMPVSDLNQVTLSTLTYARSLADHVLAVHVAADEDEASVDELTRRWHAWVPGVPLVVVESPYRSLLAPLMSYIDALHQQQPERMLTVLIPEFVASHWWEHLLHNQSALRLKAALHSRPGIVVTSVPYHLGLRDRVVPEH